MGFGIRVRLVLDRTRRMMAVSLFFSFLFPLCTFLVRFVWTSLFSNIRTYDYLYMISFPVCPYSLSSFRFVSLSARSSVTSSLSLSLPPLALFLLFSLFLSHTLLWTSILLHDLSNDSTLLLLSSPLSTRPSRPSHP